MSGLIRLGIPTSWLEQGWFWRKLANTQLWKSNRSWQFQKCIQSIQFEFLPPPSLSFHHTCSTLEASDHASDLVETSDFSFSFSCLVKRPSGLSASGQNGNVSGKSNDPSIWYVWYGAYDTASPACTSTFISPPFQYMEHIWKQSKTIKKQVHKGATMPWSLHFHWGFRTSSSALRCARPGLPRQPHSAAADAALHIPGAARRWPRSQRCFRVWHVHIFL